MMEKIVWIWLIFQILFSHGYTEDFVATKDWQEIKEGQKVPGGLHYRMNLETGKKEAKILEPENSDEKEKVTLPVLSDQNEPIEDADQMSPEKVEEMQKIMENMKMNKDIENIKTLMANYENSTLDEKLVILEDLDFYMHQVDNARDFVFVHGLSKIVQPALKSLEISENLVAKAAILLGSSAQSNTKVQVLFIFCFFKHAQDVLK